MFFAKPLQRSNLCASHRQRRWLTHGELLKRHNWPGNIRELENTLERAVLLTESALIRVDDLSLGDLSPSPETGELPPVVKIPPTGIPLEEIEKQAVVEALSMSNWVQKDAAELLSISPRVINYKIKTLDITLPRSRRSQARSAAVEAEGESEPWTVSSVG